jgi:hypothetical protein
MPKSEYYKGSGDKVYSSMVKQYGKKKGEQIFYATANKQKMNPDDNKSKKKKKSPKVRAQKVAAVLTAASRAKISKKNFAIPQKAENAGEKKKSGNYPIPDKKHARAALSLVSQHGTPEEKAQVRAKVHAKFPELGGSEKKAALFHAAYLDGYRRV